MLPAGRGGQQRAEAFLAGQPAQWTLVGFAYLGLFEGFVELDPDFTPPPVG